MCLWFVYYMAYGAIYMGCADVITCISSVFYYICGHCITTPCCGYWEHCHYVRLRRRMLLGYFCNTNLSSKQAWQNSRYFIAFTLHSVYPQDGDGNNKHRYTVSGKKEATLFSIITLATLGGFYNFYTVGNRNEYTMIICNLITWRLDDVMTVWHCTS